MIAAIPTWSIIGDVVITLAVALLFGAIAQALRQSPIIGYLAAGLILAGPSSLGLVDNVRALESIAELGVAMLLFAIGLDFSFDKLRRFGRVAIVAGLLQVALTTVISAMVLSAIGLSPTLSAVIGMMVALSSTAVVIRVLLDNGQLDSSFGLAAVGVLLMQDIILIPFLLLVPEVGAGIQFTDAAFTFGIALLKIGVLALAMYIIDYFIIARVFERLGNVAEREELLAMVTILIAFGAAWITHEMGLSAVLGAFLAGLMIAGTPYADHVRAEIGPIRVLLVTLFFASVGLLADLNFILNNAATVAGIVAVVIVGKALIASASLRLAGCRGISVWLGGLALAQMGEFSFVLATAARSVDILTASQFQMIVSVSIVTLMLTPIALSGANWLTARGTRYDNHVEPREPDSYHHIVVGYGPTGQRVTHRLLEQGMKVVVIDLNPNRGNDGPARFVHGDAGKMLILRQADIARAASVTITLTDPNRIRGIARRVRTVAADARIIVRGRHHRYIPDLVATGVDTVVDEESETGELLAQATLQSGTP